MSKPTQNMRAREGNGEKAVSPVPAVRGVPSSTVMAGTDSGGARRNPEERQVHSFIVLEPTTTGQASAFKSPSKDKDKNRFTALSSPSASVTSAENDSDLMQTPPHREISRSASSQSETVVFSARRKLRLDLGAGEERLGSPGMFDCKLPRVTLADDDDVSNDREGASDFGESEIEGGARRYLLQTLNRILVELFHACEIDLNLDRCDHVLSILQEGFRSFQTLRQNIDKSMTSSSTGVTADGLAQESGKSEGFDACSVSIADGGAEALGDVSQEEMVDMTRADSSSNIVTPPRKQTWCDVVRRHDISVDVKDGSEGPSSRSSASGQRSLHEKLLSPDRHRKNPEAVQKKHEEKQELAKKKREEMEAQRQEKLREAELQRQEKLRQVREKRETEKTTMDERLKRAHDLYQSRLLERQMKAGRETAKVHEVKQEIAFIDQLTAENNTMALQTRLELAEARRLQTLEAAAKVAERAAREVGARQRRAAMEGAKIERLQARQAQKFGTALDGLVEVPDLESGRPQTGREETRDRTTAARDEAARLRREQLEIERQRKVELAAQEKEHRAEEHQRKVIEERMKVLAAKEARLRHQQQHLDRMTKAMQADAQAQREALDERLQSVIERKQRYMEQIVAKAHAASDGKADCASPSQVTANISISAISSEKEPPEDTEDKISKSQKKRAKKFKQRLSSIRSAWQEKEEDANSVSRSSVTGGKLTKLSRLLNDVIKGAPTGEDSEKATVRGKESLRQPCRDVEGMAHALQEIHRLVIFDDYESKGSSSKKEEKEIILSTIRKSGAIAALIRVISADEALTFPKLISAALKVLNDACGHETNRLYIVATGRLIPLINLLETAMGSVPNSSSLGVSNDCQLLQQVMTTVSVCFSSSTGNAGQGQARDDSLGYFVNIGMLSKVERLIIAVVPIITASCASKGGETSDSKGSRFAVCLKILEACVTLVEAVTMCHESCGQVKPAVHDSGVLSNLVAALEEGPLVGLVPLLSTFALDAKICIPSSASNDAGSTTKEKESNVGQVKANIMLGGQAGAGMFCAIKALKALNNIAVLDLALVQRTLGSVVICSEFSHVAFEILDSCGHLSKQRSEASTQAGIASSEMLHELILLLGYMAFSSSPVNHSPFAGWRNGVLMLQQLCALPISYFISPALREVLLPTLIVATFKNPPLLDAMREQLNAELLAAYLEHYQESRDNQGLNRIGCPADGLSREWFRLPPPSVACRFHLGNRFPETNWSEACQWFRSWRYAADGETVRQPDDDAAL